MLLICILGDVFNFTEKIRETAVGPEKMARKKEVWMGVKMKPQSFEEDAVSQVQVGVGETNVDGGLITKRIDVRNSWWTWRRW